MAVDLSKYNISAVGSAEHRKLKTKLKSPGKNRAGAGGRAMHKHTYIRRRTMYILRLVIYIQS